MVLFIVNKIKKSHLHQTEKILFCWVDKMCAHMCLWVNEVNKRMRRIKNTGCKLIFEEVPIFV